MAVIACGILFLISIVLVAFAREQLWALRALAILVLVSCTACILHAVVDLCVGGQSWGSLVGPTIAFVFLGVPALRFLLTGTLGANATLAASDDDPDQCDSCGRIMEPTGASEVRLSGPGVDETITIPVSDDVYAVYGDDLCICEACYRLLRPADHAVEDMHDMHFQFGLEYMQLDRAEDARRCFESAASIQRTPDVLGHLAVTVAKLGDPHAGIRLLDEVAADEPDHPVVVMSMPRFYLDAGNYAQALDLIDGRDTPAVAPHVTLMNRAEALLGLGRSIEAEGTYHHARRVGYRCCEDCGQECDQKWEDLKG